MFHLKPMKNKSPWTLFEDSKDTLAGINGRKIVSVYQVKNGLTYKWAGELDDDRYFMLTVKEGVILGSFSEHEMMLPYEGKILAMHEVVVKVYNTKDFSARLQATIEAGKELLPVMKNITFEDVMKVLKWKYASKKVEIYHDPICMMQR